MVPFLVFSMILTADPPRFRVEVMDAGLADCSSRAINEIDEMIISCGKGNNRLFRVSDTATNPLTPPPPQFLPCVSQGVGGFNNAGQWLQRTLTTFRCGIGGSSSQSGTFHSGGASHPASFAAESLTASGRFLNGRTVWAGSNPIFTLQSESLPLESVRGLNSRLQSVVVRSRIASRYDWKTGTQQTLPRFRENPVLDERGWVAGIDPESSQLVLWDGMTSQVLGLPPGSGGFDEIYVIAMKESGWIYGKRGRDHWLWDGTQFL